MQMSYLKGQLVQCWGYFDQEGVRVTPEDVTMRVKNPNGATTVYVYGDDSELQLNGQGEYYVNVDASIAGRWYYKLESEGVDQGAMEGSFDVKAGQF